MSNITETTINFDKDAKPLINGVYLAIGPEPFYIEQVKYDQNGQPSFDIVHSKMDRKPKQTL